MKKFAIFLLLLSVTFGSFASPLRSTDDTAKDLVVRKLAPSEAAHVLDQLRFPRGAEESPMTPQVIASDRWHHSFAIPSAGSLQGGQGTYFRSDITLSNQDYADSQLVAIVWLERGVDNSEDPPVFVVELDPGIIVTVRDFVGELLETTGLGSVIFVAVDENLDADELASIDGYSRIWTPQPGNPQGTVSQQFPAVVMGLLSDWDTALAIGIRHDSAFRANVGIMNLDSEARTWEVIVASESGAGGTTMMVTVPAVSMSHVSVPAAELGSVIIQFQVQGDATDLEWLAYATSNDNITGDGWVAIATPQREDAPF